MYLEYILLALFLGFLMRIVYKKQGGYGLIFPSIISVVAGYNLLVGTPYVILSVCTACVVFAMLFRKIYHSGA